jgi:hypothetical protein
MHSTGRKSMILKGSSHGAMKTGVLRLQVPGTF